MNSRQIAVRVPIVRILIARPFETGRFCIIPRCLRRVNVLHTIHDFVPRHTAGSEIYAFELCRELSARHHVTVLAAEYDPARPHGHVTWRVEGGLPVVELVNNWECKSFEDTYR